MEPLMAVLDSFAATNDDLNRELDLFISTAQVAVDTLKMVRDKTVGEFLTQ
jgi:hypothetical protein